ncbi:hypothetical protein [Sediminimonas qiaohouensis]|uniref:hypothetical protein n=1 Tax=Sediminimonas qiaohouensis TaxID=552061 RepID=UPI0003FD835C|nr:hypothetical protein [Sediminimonas qiaohouensis]
MLHDDRFIGWACQQQLRGFPTDMVCYFRVEFFWPAIWMAGLLPYFGKLLVKT